jgi:hypothetical protein
MKKQKNTIALRLDDETYALVEARRDALRPGAALAVFAKELVVLACRPEGPCRGDAGAATKLQILFLAKLLSPLDADAVEALYAEHVEGAAAAERVPA